MTRQVAETVIKGQLFKGFKDGSPMTEEVEYTLVNVKAKTNEELMSALKRQIGSKVFDRFNLVEVIEKEPKLYYLPDEKFYELAEVVEKNKEEK